MNSMECEDPMGGLMPQILALTAPPGTKEINNKQLQQPTQSVSGQLPPNGNGPTKAGEAGLAAHPYFRRPGRGHNHDCCDACSEGGDLICCDLCPASFHLTCHDPPLEEDEIPTGEWACHQCRMGGNEDEKVSNSSNKSSKSSKLPKKKEEAKIKEECNKVYAGGREIEISDTPLYTLIRAAAVINPIQFTLPYELTIPANFPGEPKDAFIKKNGSKRSSLKKKPYELDNGIVPLPAKLCFQCNKSCRVGPLIPCDFCPLFYHLDCLDPPLTTPPMGRWMCPNHPEHHLDSSLTSHSLTERVKLWDKFSVPLDQDAVKLNFFQRCHRSNPPFRYKVKKALRSRLRVPGAIKAHYEHPPDLLPHVNHRYSVSNSYDECLPSSCSNSMWPSTNNISYTSPSKSFESNEIEETNINNANLIQDGPSIPELQEIEKMEEEEFITKPTKEEKYHWLSSLLHLQSSISRHLATNYLPVKNNIVNDLKMEISSDACNGLDESKETFSATKPKFLNGDLISLENKSHKCSGRLSGQISHSNLLASQTSCSSSKRNHKTQKSKRQSKSVIPSEIVSDTLDSLEVLLKERLKHEEEKQEIPLSSLEQNLVELLAYERLKEILDGNESDIVFSSSRLAARALLCPLVPDVKLKSILPKSKAYSTEPVPMMYRILNIGKGTHNHLNLENFGHCNYISHHHASIIFDETTGHYELLNYSEYDTVVDGVTYNCEYENKTVDQAVSPPYLQQVKAIIAMRRGGGEGDSIRSLSTPAAMCNRPGENFVRCNCRRDTNSSLRDDRERGWEGAAVLHHGSFVRFGCLKFVLSVVDEASKGDWFKDTTTTYEKFLKRAEDEREFEKQEESEHQEEDLSDNKS